MASQDIVDEDYTLKITCQGCHVETVFSERITGQVTAEMLTKIMPRNEAVLKSPEIMAVNFDQESQEKLHNSEERVDEEDMKPASKHDDSLSSDCNQNVSLLDVSRNVVSK